MSKNVTLRIDDRVVQKAWLIAADHDMSFSKWAATVIAGAVSVEEQHNAANGHSLAHLRNALRKSDRPLARRYSFHA